MHTLVHQPSSIQQSPAPRRIRFAPLPDPRRAVLVTDDGTEVPLPSCWTNPLDEKGQFYADSAVPGVYDEDDLTHCIPAAVSLAALSSPLVSGSPELFTIPSTGSPPSSYNSPILAGAKSMPLMKVVGAMPITNQNGSVTSSSDTSSTSSSESQPSLRSLTPTQSIEPAPVANGHTPGEQTPTTGHGAKFSKLHISPEHLLNLGPMKLFRTTSRTSSRGAYDPDAATPSSWRWGSPLQRWTSTDSSQTAPATSGIPMPRTQSTQSYKGNVRNKGASLISSLTSSMSANSHGSSTLALKKRKPRRPSTPGTAEKGLIATINDGASTSAGANRPKSGSTSSMKRPGSSSGTKMLNGRIYGAPRKPRASQNANPFANAKDDPDPEFVEWGYGGMGSVVRKGSERVGGKVWDKLQSGNDGVLGGDEDDGSGMGWVRRRREQREKEKKEREEAEAKEKAAAEIAAKPVEQPSTTLPAADSKASKEPATSPETQHEDATPAPKPTAQPVHTRTLSTSSSGSRTRSPLIIPLPPQSMGRTRSGSLSASAIQTPLNERPLPILHHSSLSGTATPLTPLSGPGSALPSAPGSGMPTPSLGSAPVTTSDHVTRAVAVPAPRHSHHRSYSHAQPPFTDGESLEADKVKADEPADMVQDNEINSKASEPVSPDDESESESESEEDVNRVQDEDEDEDEDDEDDEEEEGAISRKTCVGAGVEMISRHHTHK